MRAHEWTIVAEFDAGYVIGKCQACGQQDLLAVGALLPNPRSASTSSSDASHAAPEVAHR